MRQNCLVTVVKSIVLNSKRSDDFFCSQFEANEVSTRYRRDFLFVLRLIRNRIFIFGCFRSSFSSSKTGQGTVLPFSFRIEIKWIQFVEFQMWSYQVDTLNVSHSDTLDDASDAEQQKWLWAKLFQIITQLITLAISDEWPWSAVRLHMSHGLEEFCYLKFI